MVARLVVLRRVACLGAALVLAVVVPAARADEIAAAPVSDDFHYPKAKPAFVNLQFPKGVTKAWSVALLTNDAPGEVMRWYLDRVGLADSLRVTTNGLRRREVGKMKQVLTLTDIDRPRQKGEMNTRVFQAVVRESGGKRGDFVLTVTLHHRQDTGVTEILLSYIPTE